MKLKIVIGVCAAAVLWAQEPSTGGGGYEGPSILSRGIVQPGRRGDEPLRFRVFAQVNGIYDNGLLPVSVDSSGQLFSDALWGVEARIGAYGYHRWRRSSLGLDYLGNFRHYNQNTYYDGSDHTLMLDYRTQLSRRVMLQLTPAAGTYSQSFGFFGMYAAVLGTGNMSPIPLADIFDNRTYYVDAGADLIFQKSARLSFRLGGTGFGVYRQSKALVDTKGAMATADVAYRLNRSQSVFASYSFAHYSFPGVFGSTDMHLVTAGHSLRIGRNTEFLLSGGVARLELKGLQRVAVDPAIAALVGQSTTVQAFYGINYIPSAEVKLTRTYRKSTIGATARQGITPGNGLFLTSRQQTAGVFAGYTGLRRWNFSAGFSYMNLQGIGLTAGQYGTYTGGAGAIYRVAGFMHLNARVDLRRADLTITGFRRDAARISFGVTLAPGEIPVSLW